MLAVPIIENQVGPWKNDPRLRVHCNRMGAVNDVMSMIYQQPYNEEEVTQQLSQYTDNHWESMSEHLSTFPINEQRTQSELFIFLQYFHKLFTFGGGDTGTLSRIGRVYKDNLAISAKYEQLYGQLQLLETNMTRMDLLNVDTQAGRELKSMITHISFVLKTSYDVVIGLRLLQHSNDTGLRGTLMSMTSKTFQPPSIENPITQKPQQKLLAFYLEYAFNRHYRKSGKYLYKPVFNEEGIFVHSYERHQSITEFICTACYPETQNEVWFNILTSSITIVPYLEKTLEKIQSEKLPQLEYNRDIFAFTNGLYVLPLCTFFWFKAPPGCRSTSELSGNLTAIKYHKFFFDDIRMRQEATTGDMPNPLNIHMPHIKSIFIAQGYDEKEMYFIFALLGRLFHLGKRFDNWSVFPWFLGIGATGKSTLLKLVAMMYNPEDIGYLPNKPAEAFPLATAYLGLLYLALDIDDRFSLDQATFCSMVSHEQVIVNCKNEPQKSMEWPSHGAAASNMMPSRFTSVGNNLQRRIIGIEFMRIIKDGDPNLFEKCVKERPEFLHVCNSCYLQAASMFRDVGFKSVLPAKFKEMEKRCLREMNPMDSFIHEVCVLVNADDNMSMSKDEFTKAFKWWAAQNNIPPQQSKLNTVAFSSLTTYNIHEKDSGNGTILLQNVVLHQRVIPLIVEWERNKGRGSS